MKIKTLLKSAAQKTLMFSIAYLLGLSNSLAYDFSEHCSTGQLLYYNIIDYDNHYVELTYPGESPTWPWSSHYMTQGVIVMPNEVEHDGISYVVNRIGDHAFQDCSGLTGPMTLPNSITSIGESAFDNCLNLTGSLQIPSSVTEINDCAFRWCHGLSGILSIPNTVMYIGEQAFFRCSNFLGPLTIPNSVTYISAYAFNGCSGFSGEVILPKTLVSIGNNAFEDCSGLTAIIALSSTPASIGSDVFKNISPSAILKVPCGSQMLYYYSNWNVFSLDRIIEMCDTFPITINPSIFGGTITTSVDEASMGTDVYITILPESGFELESLSICNIDNPVQELSFTPVGSYYRFTMPPFGVLVSAIFSIYDNINEVDKLKCCIYPNPTSNQITIEAENIKQISIYSLLGQEIFNGKVDSNRFVYDFGEQKAGVYLIYIETTNGVAKRQVVLTK